MFGDFVANAVVHFEAPVKQALARIPPDSRLLVAVSGGADSCALLAALGRIGGNFTLICAHIVHGLRPAEEGKADEAHVRSLCDSLSIPLELIVLPPGAIIDRARTTGKGIEDAARYFRHKALRETADRLGLRYILLGHTDDDLIETVLMRFLRGSGTAGLSAMPEVNGRILRPILRLSRADVLAYLKALGLSYREDSTNSDPRYLRNRIRGRLIPVLDAEFSSWKTAVRSVANAQSELSRFISEEADRRISWFSSETFPEAMETELGVFFAADPVLRTEALYKAVDALVRDGRRRDLPLAADAPAEKDREPTRRAVGRFASGDVNAQNLGKVRVFKHDDRVVVQSSVRSGCDSGYSIVIAEDGSYRLPAGAALVSDQKKSVSVSISLPLVVRSPRRTEKSRLRSMGLAYEKDAAAIFVVEDRGGLAGVAFKGADGELKLAPAERKAGISDYAELRFFSIL